MIFGSIGPFPRAQDVFAKIQVTLLAGQAIQQHHRFEHAGRRHAHMLPGQIDVAFAGLVAKGVAQQIGHFPTGWQWSHVAGVAHVGDQPDEIVFVRPYVPERPAIFLYVGAQIAICELAFGQLGGDVIELLSQLRISGVGPGQRGGVHPFADVFAVPDLPAGPLAITFEQPFHIQLHQTVCFIGFDARADPSAKMHIVWRLKILLVSNRRPNLCWNQRALACLQRASKCEPENKAAEDCPHSKTCRILAHSNCSRSVLESGKLIPGIVFHIGKTHFGTKPRERRGSPALPKSPVMRMRPSLQSSAGLVMLNSSSFRSIGATSTS